MKAVIVIDYTTGGGGIEVVGPFRQQSTLDAAWAKVNAKLETTDDGMHEYGVSVAWMDPLPKWVSRFNRRNA